MATNEYNASLQIEPSHARSLYGLGRAKMKSGGRADVAAAVKRLPRVGDDSTRFGVTQQTALDSQRLNNGLKFCKYREY